MWYAYGYLDHKLIVSNRFNLFIIFQEIAAILNWVINSIYNAEILLRKNEIKYQKCYK